MTLETTSRRRSIRRALRSAAAGFALWLAAATVPLALAQSQGLPSLGGGDLGVSEERTLGDLIMHDVYRDPGYLDDPAIGEYVDGIWQRLRSAAISRGELAPELEERFAWDVVLVRDRAINAFSLPGGYFGVNLGLIGTVTSRDELASVLAHEMSHVTQRHIARLLGQQKRQTPLMIAALILGALAAGSNPDAGMAIAAGGQAALVQQQMSFSRDMEREADRIGYGVLTQAGFAPQGFVTMFEKLQAASRIDDNGDWPYLRSHPLTTERIADMQQRQHRLPQGPAAAPDLQALLIGARARVLAGPGVDVLQRMAGEPAQPGFAAQALPQRAAALYAAALAKAELRAIEQGRTYAEQLQPLVAADPGAARQAVLLRAELALRAGKPGEALALLEQPVAFSDSAKGAPDGASEQGRARLLLRARAEIGSGAAGAAAARLQNWVGEHPGDALAWQTLAQALQAQGSTLRALRAEGEVQMAQMDYSGAIDRWRAAQDFSRRSAATPADLIEASIVDARLRVAQEALRQQQQDEKKWS